MEKIGLLDVVNYVKELLVKFGLNIAIAIGIIVGGVFLAKVLKRVLRKVLEKRHVEKTIAQFVVDLLYFTLIALIIVAALSQLGIETSSFIAILGAAGLAVGLALQGSLSNFASGILLIIFKHFSVGDYIEVSEKSGIVENIKIFTTQIVTFDNKTVIIPNAQITSGNIINYTMKRIRRVDMVFGISYDDDIKKCKEVMEKTLKADERVLQEPAIFVGIKEFADSSVNFVVRPWVKTDDYWDVYYSMMEKIKFALDDAGITIPYPQRDLHVYNHPEKETEVEKILQPKVEEKDKNKNKADEKFRKEEGSEDGEV